MIRHWHYANICIMEQLLFYKVINNEGDVSKDPRKPRNKKWTIEQINQCIQYIEEKNTQITLNNLLAVCIKEFHFPIISLATLWNYLEEQLITVKLVAVQNQMRNSEKNIAERHAFAAEFLGHQEDTFFYVDETGFNLNTMRHLGRSKKELKQLS